MRHCSILRFSWSILRNIRPTTTDPGHKYTPCIKYFGSALWLDILWLNAKGGLILHFYKACSLAGLVQNKVTAILCLPCVQHMRIAFMEPSLCEMTHLKVSKIHNSQWPVSFVYLFRYRIPSDNNRMVQKVCREPPGTEDNDLRGFFRIS